MGSNYQTTNENIFETAIDLVDNKQYKELNRTDNYKLCNYLVIDHVEKQFFFTKKENITHFENLIKLIN